MNVLTTKQVLRLCKQEKIDITMAGLRYYIQKRKLLIPCNRPSNALLFEAGHVREFVDYLKSTPRRGPRTGQ